VRDAVVTDGGDRIGLSGIRALRIPAPASLQEA
jgi:hypothetical protein